MILDFFKDELNGDTWEELCQSCYRIKYQDQHYTEIPASYRGDAGIEGFTRNGIVNQCYCTEKAFSDDDLYNHQRDKVTTDIGKLIDPDYKKRLKKLGVPQIHEWHFVIPCYKDSRIIQHAETKRQEVLKAKKDNPEQYDYIADDFIVVIKQAEDFKFEITRTIRESITDKKLNVAVREVKDIDWSLCDSEKVNNIRRKVKAVMDDAEDSDPVLNQVVNMYIESYIKGMEIMKLLRVSYAAIYEDVHGLEQAYKKQVALKTGMNTNKSMNSQIFNEILNDFEVHLKDTCGYFDSASIIELKIDIVSMWLADCSMLFRK